MKLLFLITARGGSKGIRGKNIRLLGGEPLIGYTIRAAKQSAETNDICVSTDSSEIQQVAASYGLHIPFTRPSEFATDKASSDSVIQHAYKHYLEKGKRYDGIVLLQPTSPFRRAEHITEAIKLFNHNLDMVVSVKESPHNPYFNLFQETDSGILEKYFSSLYTRRQDCPPAYSYNGAIYVINTNSLNKPMSSFTKVIPYKMDAISSIDIDTPIDFEWAEFILKKGLN